MRPAARRVLTIAAAAAAGLAGSLAIGSPASAHLPAVSVDSVVCDRSAGEWVIGWKVHGTSVPAEASTWQLTTVTFTPPPPTSVISGDLASANVWKPKAQDFTGTQRVPGSTGSVSLSVVAAWDDDDEATHDGSKTKSLTGVGSCVKTYAIALTCDSITFTFRAPPAPVETAAARLTDTGVHLAGSALTSSRVHLHPSVGADVDFTLASGDPDKVVTFPGSPGLTVEVTIGDGPKRTHAFTPDPCPPSPSASLAQTGSSVTGPVGVGAALLVVGAGLIAALFVFRRRRTVARN
jgi:hypothetical protein